MNKAVTSFWKRMFFRYDISRMRKAVVDYLTVERRETPDWICYRSGFFPSRGDGSGGL